MLRARWSLAVTFFALTACPSGASAAEKAAVPFADLTIHYDPARWEVRDGPNAKGQLWADPAPVRLYFVCIAPDCYDRPSVWVSAVPSGSSLHDRCTPPGLVEDWRYNERSILGIPATGRDFGGLTLHGIKTFSGCRARTPSARRACGSAGGTDYAFGSGAHFGCSGIEGVPDEMFIELLSGISLNAANPGKAGPGTISPPPNP